jgi:hypothetical protein
MSAAVSPPRSEATSVARWGDVDVIGEEGSTLDMGLLTTSVGDGITDDGVLQINQSSGHFAEWESLPDKYLQSDNATYLTYFKAFVGAGVLFLPSVRRLVSISLRVTYAVTVISLIMFMTSWPAYR